MKVGNHMNIAIGNDHTAIELKKVISEHLIECGFNIINMGADTEKCSDYPVYAKKVCAEVLSGKADLGILICGTGVGMSLTANKLKGIRAVVCSEPYTALLSREHNDTNILTFGARVVGSELAKMIVDTWLNASFLGGRHSKRVEMFEDQE